MITRPAVLGPSPNPCLTPKCTPRTAGGPYGRKRSGQFRNGCREPFLGPSDRCPRKSVWSHETVSVSSQGSPETETVSQIPSQQAETILRCVPASSISGQRPVSMASSPPPLATTACLRAISPRILKRRGTPPSEPSAKLTRPHNWDGHARHPRRCGLELGLTLRLPSRRRRDDASTHLTIGNRANRRLLRCTYGSARYSEAGFETPAVVGNLSQSNATTGRAVGHPKSRWLFSLLGGAERRAGIIVLPPRSTFCQTHSAATPSQARPA